MIRQLRVDFNRVVQGSLIRANARRAVDGADLDVGMTVVVGDDDWQWSRLRWWNTITSRDRWCCA